MHDRASIASSDIIVAVPARIVAPTRSSTGVALIAKPIGVGSTVATNTPATRRSSGLPRSRPTAQTSPMSSFSEKYARPFSSYSAVRMVGDCAPQVSSTRRGVSSGCIETTGLPSSYRPR
jgi:hypothetical protein